MTYEAEVLADSPLVYWRLGESAGTTAVDDSGNGHDGTYVDGPTLGATGLLVGDADTAVTFAGSPDRVESVDDFGSTSYSEFTLEAIVNLSTFATSPIICGMVDGAYAQWLLFYILNTGGVGHIDFEFTGPSTAIHSTASGPHTDLVTGTRYHIACTYDGATLTVYLDGAVEATLAAVDIADLPDPALFYVGDDSFGEGAVGTIDEVAFYASALDATRIGAHYTASLGAGPGQEIDLDFVDLALTIPTPTIVRHGSIDVDFVDLALTIYEPTVVEVSPIDVPFVDLALTIYEPAVNRAGEVLVPFVDLSLTIHTPSIGAHPPTGFAEAIAIRVVDKFGHVELELDDAWVDTITKEKNVVTEADVVFPKYSYSRDDIPILSADTAPDELRELQVIRDGKVRFWGPAISSDAASDRGEIRLACRGVDHYLTRLYLDKARTNLLGSNASFELGNLAGWTLVGAATTEVTSDDAIRGDYSFRGASLTPLGDIYLRRRVNVTGTGVGTALTVAGYFKVETPGGLGGHSIDRRGLYIEGIKDGVIKANNYYPVDEANPAGEWQRAKTTITVPPLETWTIEVRLYIPPGAMLWDDLQLVKMESLSTAGLTGSVSTPADVSRIFRMVHLFAMQKSPANIGMTTPNVGVRQVKHFQFAAHISWLDAMAEWLERDDLFDYSMAYTATTRKIVLHVHNQGRDLSGTINLTFPGVIAHHTLGEDGASIINDDTELDADTGDGPDREEGHYIDLDAAGGMTFQSVTQAPANAEIDSLDRIAKEKVNKGRRPKAIFTVTIKNTDAHAYDDELDIGDKVSFDIVDGYATLSGKARIAKIVEHPRDRTLELTLNKV